MGVRVAIALAEDLPPAAAAATAGFLDLHLTRAGLQAELSPPGAPRSYVLVTAPELALAEEAERVGLLKMRKPAPPLKGSSLKQPHADDEADDEGFARGWGREGVFDLALADEFWGWGDPGGFFLPCEEGELLMGLIGAVVDADTLAPLETLLACANRLPPRGGGRAAALAAAEGSLLRGLEAAGLVAFVTPLHDPTARAALSRSNFRALLAPVAEVHAYFGAEVALYFAWMNFFTMWLVGLGVFGAAVYAHRELNGYTVDNHPLLPFFSLAAAAWGVAFMVCWRRAEARWALKFGSHGAHGAEVDTEPPRPEFVGVPVVSAVTGKQVLFYPTWKRWCSYALSLVVSSAFLAVAAAVIVVSLNFQGYVQDVDLWQERLVHVPAVAAWSAPGATFDPNGCLFFVPTIVHVLVIMALNTAYRSAAVALTRLENHPTDTDFANALVLKRFAFESFDSFIPLFYLAFVQFDIIRVRSELVALYTVDSVRRVGTEALLPLLTHKLSAYATRRARAKASGKHKKGDQDSGRCGGGGSEAVCLELEDEEYEQFDDFLEMIIEFGYVVLFASAYPLAAAVSVVCNIVELKSDLFKLCFVNRRPPPKRSADMGTWNLLIRCTVYLSIATNLCLFAFSSKQMAVWFPDLDQDLAPAGLPGTEEGFAGCLAPGGALTGSGGGANPASATARLLAATGLSGKYGALVLILVVEHALVLAAAVAEAAVPHVPQDVHDEVARVAHHRKVFAKNALRLKHRAAAAAAAAAADDGDDNDDKGTTARKAAPKAALAAGAASASDADALAHGSFAPIFAPRSLAASPAAASPAGSEPSLGKPPLAPASRKKKKKKKGAGTLTSTTIE